MFHSIPERMLEVMHDLEHADSKDREDGTPHLERLRQVPPITGRFLALLAAGAPEGVFLEVGTSAGYSALWISLALFGNSRRFFTYELLPEKVRRAQDTFAKTGLGERIELVPDDVQNHFGSFQNIAFAFIDAEKDLYEKCYEPIVSNLVPRGILAADNVTSHKEVLQPFVEHAEGDPRIDSLEGWLTKGLLRAD